MAEEKKQEKKDQEIPKAPVVVDEQLVETKHTLTFGKRQVKYTATAGTLVLKEEDDEKGEHKPKASVFYVAYIADRPKNSKPRPLTFSFNGGPGSSSVWLHLGVLGPRRISMPSDAGTPPPPYELLDNDYSILDVTDLVFIDPVTTGFSRVVPGEEAKQFHGFQKDMQLVAEFIRLFTTRHMRWTSPKFLIGESYGTTRAAALSGHLQERHGFYLNGIMLISSILDFSTADFNPGNDLPYILFLPTYAATAWYHRRLEDNLQKSLRKTLDEVEAFASGEYTLALMKGDTLGKKEREEIAQKLSRYTGLSREYIQRTNLRIEIHRFTKELLRSKRQTVGRLDSRFISHDRDAAGEHFEFDPSYAAIQGPFTAALNQYVRQELNFKSDLPYEILSERVHPWSYKEHENQYLNVAETLRKAINLNPALRVFVANGYYDLATPYYATAHTFNHLQLEPDLRPNISMEYYEAGNMMYIHEPSLVAQKKHLADFIKRSS
jgi:carboxypeptidase C (cathepsin A)